MRPERFELEALCGRQPAAEILSLLLAKDLQPSKLGLLVRPERFELEAFCGRQPAAEILSLLLAKDLQPSDIRAAGAPGEIRT